MDQSKWDRSWLEVAEFMAAKFSKDPRTKVGCVIAKGKQLISMGYNGFPAGVDDDAERYTDRELKNLLVVHAEQNAIHWAAGILHDRSQWTLYSTLKPCHHCAKIICQSQIKRVVSWTSDRDGADLNWAITDLIFKESGVDLILLNR